MDTQDALEFILAGASAVSVGTANFINPSAAAEIIWGIETYLRENKIPGMKQLDRGFKNMKPDPKLIIALDFDT